MKKIINGKQLNTDTAKLIGEWDNGYQFTDFSYCYENLHLTRSGVYFLHYGGNANSCYGVWHGNSGGSGEGIKVLSYDQARQWAEEHLNAENYTAHFEVVSDNQVSLGCLITEAANAKIRRLASQNGVTLGEMVTKIINEYDEAEYNNV